LYILLHFLISPYCFASCMSIFERARSIGFNRTHGNLP